MNDMDERTRIYHELIKAIVRMGYPEEFGRLVADNLRTEKTMSRMLGYLRQARPTSAEEIADEMLYYGLDGDEDDAADSEESS